MAILQRILLPFTLFIFLFVPFKSNIKKLSWFWKKRNEHRQLFQRNQRKASTSSLPHHEPTSARSETTDYQKHRSRSTRTRPTIPPPIIPPTPSPSFSSILFPSICPATVTEPETTPPFPFPSICPAMVIEPKTTPSIPSPLPQSTSNIIPSTNPTDVLSSSETKQIPSKLSFSGTLRGIAKENEFGSSVSLHQNGNLLTIGSPGYSTDGSVNSGLVQLYRRHRVDTAKWQQIGGNITGENDDEYAGRSVCLSGDGKLLAYGVPRADDFTGYANIHQVGMMEHDSTEKLIGNDKGDWFGGSVSLSHNGSRVAVAAKYGYVRIHEFEAGWVQLGETFLGDSPSVVLSGDGNFVAIGVTSQELYKGRVSVYRWEAPAWVQVGKTIKGERSGDEFGHSLDISEGGERIVIGSYGGNYAMVYGYSSGDWKVIGDKLMGNEDDFGGFAFSVSISDDGDRVVVGSPRFKSDGLLRRGRAVVYRYDDTKWVQVGNSMIGDNDDDRYGWTVSMSGDGHYVAVGAPYAGLAQETNVGYVSVFKIE